MHHVSQVSLHGEGGSLDQPQQTRQSYQHMPYPVIMAKGYIPSSSCGLHSDKESQKQQFDSGH